MMLCQSTYRFCRALGLGLLATILVEGTESFAKASSSGLFGTIEISSSNLSALPQWQRVIASFPSTADAAKKCDAKIEDCQSQQMTLWRAKINELQHSNKRVQLQDINRFFNSWRHVSDVVTHGASDYWATPLEFISNGGDSEDFAIMKYVSLKELGFTPESMRIVISNDVLRNNIHAVLSVSLRGQRYILDSLTNTILKEELVRYYVPLYSVNEKRRWAHIPPRTIVAQDAAGVGAND